MSENGVCFFGKQYDIPVISTQDITHFLRSKSEILEDQLKTANDLLHGSINVYFIQKEAFLLNWVLDKLKEIKLNKENSIDILLKLWNFLSIVLKSQNLSIESKCFSFQKYSFTVILSVSLSLATEITDEKELLSLISSIEENVNYVLSQETLCLFVRGSFDAATAILANFFCCIRNLDLHNDIISNIGHKIFKIWKNSIYGFENFKNVSEVVASKVLPHVCYLYRIRDIPLWVDDLFSAILYKTLFSPESLINYINFQVSNSEFEETDSKISNLRLFLNRLMDSLTDISYHSNVLLSLPKFLEIAQNSLNRNLIYSRVKVNLNPSKMTYLTHMFLSEILKIALELPVKQDVLKYSIISDILELSENNKSYHKSFGVLEQQMLEILKKAFFLIENQEDNMIIIGWKLLNSLLKFDFELVLPYNQQLWSGFRRIDMTSEYSEICCKVIKIFVNNHKIYRSLHEFISDWIKSLNFSLHNNCILLSDEILIIVMELTNNLSLNQIKTIINYILEENNYDMLKKSIYSELKKDLSKNRVKSSFFSFYPLLSILHESIDILIIKNILEDLVELYKFILEKVFSNISFFLDDPGTYLIFRIHYKAMLLSNEYISLTDPYKTLEYMKSISMLEKVDPKIIFYTTQCQFVYLQYFDQNSTEFKAEKFSLLMDLILNRIILSLEHTSNNSSWKAGKMQLIDNTNISIAYIYTINNQWMHLINKFSFFNKIKEIVDIFLKYSVENTLEEININQILTFSNLFYIYLRNAEMYELSLFRDVYIFSFIDYVSSNEFDKSLFLNCIQSYSNKKLCEEFIKKKMDNYSILKFKKIVKYLQIIPVDCIEDLAKEKLLNFLFYIDFQFSKQCFMDIVFENRKLIYRIMVTTNSESMLYDIFSLIYLYVSLDNTKTNDDSLITVSNSISKEILRKKILSNDSLISKLIEIIEKYELDIFDQYCRFLCQKNEDEFYISGIVQLILMLFFEIQNELKLSIHAPLGKKINKLAKFFFKIIKKSLKELLSFFQKNNLNFEKILNSKYLFRFFFQLSPSISFTSSDKDFLKQFIFIVSKGCFYYEDVNICLHKKFQDLLSLLLKIYSSKAENYDDILDICVTLISVFKNVQFFYTDKLEVSSYFDFQSISIYYFIQQRLQNIEFQDFKRVSIILSYSSWEIEDVNAVANILCVILLSKIEKENNLQQKYSKLFQTVVFRLVLFAKKTTNLRVLYNFINLFNILLLKKSSHFSLQNLDQLFVIIVTSLSPSVLILNESDITNDDICKGFCRMIFLMLKKNYKKLLKRYHLLTLCFQSLLHLFFYKNTNIKMTKNSTFQRRPNWVLDSSSCSSSSAKIYSDVLLYWVNASQLNKDIKKPNLGSSKTFERAIAKYLLWIIIEYIKLLLHYSINNDVKDVLTLLIMEIFKIFSTNEFEMINNILDNQGKVVFKKLYDNYMKHDKWNEA